MNHTEVRRARTAAQPHWVWSGVAELVRPPRAKRKLRFAASLLPCRQSPVESIVVEFLDLGAKYQRYLHQDEFGPTRAEGMEALRQLLKQVTALLSKLNGLPEHLRSQLDSRVSLDERSRSLCVTSGGSYAEDDETVVELLYEAAADETQAADDAWLMEALAEGARETWLFLCALDTTTSWEVVIAGNFVPPDASDADALSLLRSRIMDLSRRFKLALDRLTRRRGPEGGLSLRWLVRQLCDLWCRETGQPVTSSAVRGGAYTSKPQSPAGKFVLAAAEALQPSKSWIREHEYREAPVRARIVALPGDLHRRVHSAMREYVTDHASASRRGRPKGKKQLCKCAAPPSGIRRGHEKPPTSR